MIVETIFLIIGIGGAVAYGMKCKNRAISMRRDSQWGYKALYRTQAAKSLDVVIFEIKEMRCYSSMTSHIYETLAAVHGVKEVQMKSSRKHAVVVFDPKEVDKEYLRQILGRKMHFS